MAKHYTPEQDAIILDGQISYQEIANQLGKTYNSIEKRAARLRKMNVDFNDSVALDLGELQRMRNWNRIQNQLRLEGKKRCIACTEELDLEFFAIRHAGVRKGEVVSGRCLKCEEKKLIQKRQRISASRSRPFSYASLDDLLRFRYNCLTRRAKNKGWSCDITFQDLQDIYTQQKGLCYYTHKNMEVNNSKKDSVSVDRKNPQKGYIKGNVVLCRSDVNYMKSQFTCSEFADMCRSVVEVLENKGKK